MSHFGVYLCRLRWHLWNIYKIKSRNINVEMQFSNCFSDFFVWNICNVGQGRIKGGGLSSLALGGGGPSPPPHWKFMNHDMKENHQGMKDTTKTILNIWPELKYLVRGGLNDYLFFFELFFFFIIKKPKKNLN